MKMREVENDYPDEIILVMGVYGAGLIELVVKIKNFLTEKGIMLDAEGIIRPVTIDPYFEKINFIKGVILLPILPDHYWFGGERIMVDKSYPKEMKESCQKRGIPFLLLNDNFIEKENWNEIEDWVASHFS